jgi:hypothetical protein
MDLDLHTDIKSLMKQGDHLFAQKRIIDSRNQEIADNFYVARADFTVQRNPGEDWADHLMTSYPEKIRRDLGDQLGSMLRPRSQPWFAVRADREEREDQEAKLWLEDKTKIMRRMMYDKKSRFTKAVKEGDHDFAAFGGCCISVEYNPRDVALLYRCWHLRDVAWYEDAYGAIGGVFRNWKPTVKELCEYFPKSVHPKIRERKDKEPFAPVSVRHVIIRSDDYDAQKRFHQPWTSVFVDVENNHAMEEIGSWTRRYVLPRWMTISGSQYPYSPAALVALPDARMIQAMTLTMLDASERAASPPMIGVAEAIQGDLQLFANGFTAVDAEYDERLGEVLRPLNQDLRGLPLGVDMIDRSGAQILDAFYLNKLGLPPHGGPEMTAFETGQRVQEYIRGALPLFEPMEDEYNAELCDMTFETGLHHGAFGSPRDMPESLQGSETTYEFESPLREMLERKKGQTFLEAKAMITEAVDMDPATRHTLDFRTTIRDVLSGIGAPQVWLNSEAEVEAAAEADAQQVAAAQQMEMMQSGGEAAAKLGQAAQAFAPEAA